MKAEEKRICLNHMKSPVFKGFSLIKRACSYDFISHAEAARAQPVTRAR